MSEGKLGIIGAGRMAEIFANNARAMGIETHCFAWQERAIAADSVDCFYPISITEKDEFLQKCKEIGINGVVATNEFTISVAAYVAEQMGLNGISYDVSKMITDKYRNREKTKDVEGLIHPRYAKISSPNEVIGLGQVSNNS